MTTANAQLLNGLRTYLEANPHIGQSMQGWDDSHPNELHNATADQLRFWVANHVYTNHEEEQASRWIAVNNENCPVELKCYFLREGITEDDPHGEDFSIHFMRKLEKEYSSEPEYFYEVDFDIATLTSTVKFYAEQSVVSGVEIYLTEDSTNADIQKAIEEVYTYLRLEGIPDIEELEIIQQRIWNYLKTVTFGVSAGFHNEPLSELVIWKTDFTVAKPRVFEVRDFYSM